MSIGMMLISVELLIMLCILLSFRVTTPDLAHCFAIGESLGAAALRIAGGISLRLPTSRRLMKIVFKIRKTTRATPV